jgi:hypothetical protein
MSKIFIVVFSLSVSTANINADEICPEGTIQYHNGNPVGCHYTPAGIAQLGIPLNKVCPVAERGFTLKRSSTWIKPSRFLSNGKGCLTCIHTSHEDLPGTDTGIAATALNNGDYSGFSPELNCLGPEQSMKPTRASGVSISGPATAVKSYTGPEFCLQTYDREHFVATSQTSNAVVRAEATGCESSGLTTMTLYKQGNPSTDINVGDEIQILTRLGGVLVRAGDGGLQGNGQLADNRTIFVVGRVSSPGRPTVPWIQAGDVITLQNKQSGHYLVAENAGGDEVNANRDNAMTWEQFVLVKP